MTAPMTDAEIREALARAERATCSCHIEITRVHGFPQGHRSDCARTDVPRLAADLLAARAERDEAVSKLRTCTTCDGTGKMDVVVGVLPPDEREVLALELCGECHGTGVSSWGQALAGAEAAERERDEARAAWKLTVERPTKEELRSALARAETAERERDEAVRGRLAAEASIAAKRTALTEKDAALRLAAVRLDAMAWVWCGGGCDSVFIKPENKPLRPLTFEMVREAARGVERLLAHYAMRTVRRLEPTEEPDETRRAIWAATAAAATAAQSIRDSESRVAALEAVERAAREYRRLQYDSLEATHGDSIAASAARRVLDAALAAVEVPSG